MYKNKVPCGDIILCAMIVASAGSLMCGLVQAECTFCGEQSNVGDCKRDCCKAFQCFQTVSLGDGVVCNWGDVASCPPCAVLPLQTLTLVTVNGLGGNCVAGTKPMNVWDVDPCTPYCSQCQIGCNESINCAMARNPVATTASVCTPKRS